MAEIELEQARKLLQRSSVRELRRLHLELVDDNLQIIGQVKSFYHKQLAQEVVRQVVGDRIINDLGVSNGTS
jgi:hypothetical protein